jgi:hypothetical protein
MQNAQRVEDDNAECMEMYDTTEVQQHLKRGSHLSLVSDKTTNELGGLAFQVFLMFSQHTKPDLISGFLSKSVFH